MLPGMRMRHLATVAAFLAALPAQDPADLADLLEPIRARHGVPALGAAVIRDGELAALGAVGLRRLGHPETVTANDLWHLGSCTKAMTATLLARQVEAGKLTWATTVAAALPDLATKFHADARSITVAHLLTHRAGLPGGPPGPLWRELFRYEGSTRQARQDVLTAMLAVAPEAAPGQRFLYSNASYMIAGAIAEQTADASWEELLQKDVFTPLGITGVGFGPPGNERSTDQPWGHRRAKGQREPSPVFGDNPPALGPAGTVHMSLRDWAKFVQLHLGVAPAGKDLLLPAARLAEMRTPPEGADYALGWRVTKRPWAKGPVLMHAGSNTMWFCIAWLAPDERFAVLVTCNQGEADKACDEAAGACIRRFRPTSAK